METGGTLDEWAEHNIKITVDYEIKQQNDDYLSFVVRGTENWTNAYSESKYYNLDLNTGKIVTLKDMLGSDYIELANKSIREQIAKRQNVGETFLRQRKEGLQGFQKMSGSISMKITVRLSFLKNMKLLPAHQERLNLR